MRPEILSAAEAPEPRPPPFDRWKSCEMPDATNGAARRPARSIEAADVFEAAKEGIRLPPVHEATGAVDVSPQRQARLARIEANIADAEQKVTEQALRYELMEFDGQNTEREMVLLKTFEAIYVELVRFRQILLANVDDGARARNAGLSR